MHFRCPRCGKVLSVTQEQGGQTVSCPACGTSLAIPTTEPLPLAEPVSPPPAALRPKPVEVLPEPLPIPPVLPPQAEALRSRGLAGVPALRRSSAGDAPGWGHVHTALVLELIATGLFLAGVLLVGVGFVIYLKTDPAPGQQDVTEQVLSRVGGLFLLAGWLLAVVGYGFAVAAPGNNGDSGLGVASLLLGIAVIGLLVVFVLQLMALRGHRVAPGVNIPGKVRHRSEPTSLIVIALLLWLADSARLTVFAFFQRVVGLSLRDRELARAGLALGIALPCILFGDFLFAVVASTLEDSLGLRVFIVFVHLLAVSVVLVWYVVVLVMARRSVRDWRWGD